MLKRRMCSDNPDDISCLTPEELLMHGFKKYPTIPKNWRKCSDNPDDISCLTVEEVADLRALGKL